MKNSRLVLCLSAAFLLTLGSLGCGSGSGTLAAPVAAVSHTSHPLVAQYTITNSQPGLSAYVEFGTDTTYGRQTSVAANPATSSSVQTLNILVAGMIPQTTYHMRAHATWTSGSWVDEDHTFTTGAIPTSEPPPQFQVASLPAVPGVTPAPGVEFVNATSTSGANMLNVLAVDLQGNIIWYCPQTVIPFKLMSNGHYIFNMGTELREVDLTCSTIRDITLAQVNASLQAGGYDFTIPPPLGIAGGSPFHHDIVVLPNGHWLTLCQISKSFDNLTGYPGTTAVAGDAVIDIDLNGNVVWAWNSFDHLDVNRHQYFGLPDWTHSNAIVPTADGNLLVSMRAQSWVLKLDYANGTGAGDILWQLGSSWPGDVGTFFTLSGGDPTQWFYSQHFPNIVSTSGSQTTISFMDNGDYRSDSTGLQCGRAPDVPTSPPCYTRGVILQIDESAYTASVIWEDLPGVYSPWGGSAGVLSNGDVEFDLTQPAGVASSQIMEVTQTDTPQTVWQLNITGENAYRGYRVPSLYPGVTWQQ